MEVLHLSVGRGKGDKMAYCVPMSSRRCRGSIVRIKNMGARGSPCGTPLT